MKCRRMKMACMHCAASRTHASPVDAPSHQTLLLYMRAVLLALPPHGGMHVSKFGYENKKNRWHENCPPSLTL